MLRRESSIKIPFWRAVSFPKRKKIRERKKKENNNLEFKKKHGFNHICVTASHTFPPSSPHLLRKIVNIPLN